MPVAVPERPDLFSGRTFARALAVCVGGFLLFALVPVPLFGLGGLLGLFVGAFLLGLRGGRRAYLEVAAAGAVAAGVATMLTQLLVAVAVGPVPVAAVGAGAGLLAAVGGHYFGRDLRAGLTREL
jgi:hypothetical protein